MDYKEYSKELNKMESNIFVVDDKVQFLGLVRGFLLGLFIGQVFLLFLEQLAVSFNTMLIIVGAETFLFFLIVVFKIKIEKKLIKLIVKRDLFIGQKIGK